MRTPNRRPGKYTFKTYDRHLTQAKFDALKKKLEQIKKVIRPTAIKEMRQAAEDGDFSENAGYQAAKSKLRGLNKTIEEIEEQLKDVQIIKLSKNTQQIQLGHSVTLISQGKKYTWRILGSTETNPSKGIISHSSPLGSALLGKKVGDKIKIKDIEYQILKIE